MSDLDDQLAQAIEESRAVAVPPVAVGVEAPAKPRGKRHLGLLIGLVLAGLTMVGLVATSFQGERVYSKGVDALLQERGRLEGRSVRVEGKLVSGTLKRRAEPCEYRFTLERNGAQVPVSFAGCVVPDTFRDVPGMDVEVTAEGKLSKDGQFLATQIMSKCPSKYEERMKKGEKLPYGEAQSSL